MRKKTRAPSPASFQPTPHGSSSPAPITSPFPSHKHTVTSAEAAPLPQSVTQPQPLTFPAPRQKADSQLLRSPLLETHTS